MPGNEVNFAETCKQRVWLALDAVKDPAVSVVVLFHQVSTVGLLQTGTTSKKLWLKNKNEKDAFMTEAENSMVESLKNYSKHASIVLVV